VYDGEQMLALKALHLIASGVSQFLKKIPNEEISNEKEEARPIPSIGASPSLAQVFGASGTEDRARRIGGIRGQIMATFAAKDE
jgi:hypothetical protein